MTLPWPLAYFAHLRTGLVVLWGYLLWYLATLAFHFDPNPAIWLNALGLSALIGVALLLGIPPAQRPPRRSWARARLFMMPFAVSSFSALIKGQGFVLILPPRPLEQAVSLAVVGGFFAAVLLLRRMAR